MKPLGRGITTACTRSPRFDETLWPSKTRCVPPYNFAPIYHAPGESGKALDYPERGYEQKDVRMVFLKVEPRGTKLRAG